MFDGVSTLTILKLGLVLAGASLFFYAVRAENETLRWLAIGLVAVAFLLRFVTPASKQGDEERKTPPRT